MGTQQRLIYNMLRGTCKHTRTHACRL